MIDIQSYIHSGILELHAAGALTQDEASEVENLASLHSEIKLALEAAHEVHALLMRSAAKVSPAHLKRRVMNAIDKEKAASAALPPMLHPASEIADFGPWLNAIDHTLPADFDDTYFQALEGDDAVENAVVWIKHRLEEEPHTHFIERFLILEGTCIISVEGDQHIMQAGDYVEIPRFKRHWVEVTSECPCKFILQRIAC